MDNQLVDALKGNSKGEFVSGIIVTPKGNYIPKTDDLIAEAKVAARESGLSRFRLWVNGKQIMAETDLPTRKISELAEVAKVEGIVDDKGEGKPSVRVEKYDRAGCWIA
jgi:hypothetical protein